MNYITQTSPLLRKFSPVDSQMNLLINLILVIAGTAIITLSSKINVPMYPVPMTMQTLVILVIGYFYGPILGLSTISLYLIQGSFGLPVFAGTPEKGIGIAYMLGPTGGYLLGFLVATTFSGHLTTFFKNFTLLSSALVMIIGHVIIYAFGLLHLGNLFGYNEKILVFGLYPFLYGDAVKIALGTLLIPAIAKIMKIQ